MTFDYTIILGNKLPPRSYVYLVLPKQNYYFVNLGATLTECLLYDCDDRFLSVKALTARSSSGSFDTEVPITDAYYNFDGRDELHDVIEISLNNEEDIEAGYNLKFQIYPCKNPPTL